MSATTHEGFGSAGCDMKLRREGEGDGTRQHRLQFPLPKCAPQVTEPREIHIGTWDVTQEVPEEGAYQSAVAMAARAASSESRRR